MGEFCDMVTSSRLMLELTWVWSGRVSWFLPIGDSGTSPERQIVVGHKKRELGKYESMQHYTYYF